MVMINMFIMYLYYNTNHVTLSTRECNKEIKI